MTDWSIVAPIRTSTIRITDSGDVRVTVGGRVRVTRDDTTAWGGQDGATDTWVRVAPNLSPWVVSP